MSSIPFKNSQIIEYTGNRKSVGILVDDWDSLRRNSTDFMSFIECCFLFQKENLIIVSQKDTSASPAILKEYLSKSIVIDRRILSQSRLFRLIQKAYRFENGKLTLFRFSFTSQPTFAARFGLVISNGFGLGHVVRMKTIAHALASYGEIGIMSFSAALIESKEWPVFYLASAEYLKLYKEEGFIYMREATRRFIEHFYPTHLFYDGNVLPLGMLSALADRPNIHLTWIRRGMWQPDTAPSYMVQQALVDVVIEPGDLADEYDTGPTRHSRNDFVEPQTFIKTLPIHPSKPQMDKDCAHKILGLLPGNRYALLMLGASQDNTLETLLVHIIQQVQNCGMCPVIAHWPISHRPAPKIKGVTIIECMPIAPYYNAFDIIISAAGYNSYHELLASELPVIFMPQEDAGRDQQLARAQYAEDQGWAKLCRQQEVSTLHTHINSLLHNPSTAFASPLWLEDWRPLVKILCGKIPDFSLQSRQEIHSFPDLNIIAIFEKLFSRARYYPFEVRFIFLSSERELASIENLLLEPNIRSVIITDTLHPITLRRKNLEYLWFNRAWFSTHYSLVRQFNCWLKVWRPGEIVYFLENQIQHVRLKEREDIPDFK